MNEVRFFAIKKTYVKDISSENFISLSAVAQQQQNIQDPQVKVSSHVSETRIDQDTVEFTLNIVLDIFEKDKDLKLLHINVGQACLVALNTELDKQSIEYQKLVAKLYTEILAPYGAEVIADLTMKAGLSPIYILLQ